MRISNCDVQFFPSSLQKVKIYQHAVSVMNFVEEPSVLSGS